MGQRGEDYEIWLEGLDRSQYQKLNDNLETKTVVIGGGITGIVTAYFLAKAGQEVVLVEKGRLGEWTTDCTTGFLTQSIDTSYSDLIFMFGRSQAIEVAQSHRVAIDLIEKISKEENISCDFKRVPNFVVARSKKESRQLKFEAKIMESLGLEAKYFESNDIGVLN